MQASVVAKVAQKKSKKNEAVPLITDLWLTFQEDFIRAALGAQCKAVSKGPILFILSGILW